MASTLKEKLELCAKNRTIVRYQPRVRVSTTCRQALAEIERLEAELARRLPVYDPEDFGVRSVPPCGDCNERGRCTMNCGPSAATPPSESRSD